VLSERLWELARVNGAFINPLYAGKFPNLRNLLCGLILRDWQRHCECVSRRKHHYETVCPLTEEIRRVIKRYHSRNLKKFIWQKMVHGKVSVLTECENALNFVKFPKQ